MSAKSLIRAHLWTKYGQCAESENTAVLLLDFQKPLSAKCKKTKRIDIEVGKIYKN